MKVLSLFSGIGAFEKALDRQGIDYELVGFSEIDKYATKSYCAIHNVDESMNLGDITKVDEKTLPKDIDLLTYGFPCQDISLAGKGKGLFNADGTKTRSGLFFDALRIIEEAQPKVAIAENVKNLTGKKFKLQFEIVLKMLEAAGYNNYWQVLNAKDYGIPQNRERVFIISIRKDIDTGFFQFPEGFPLELRLKDMLESKVDEKYYLSDKAIAGFNRHSERNANKGNGFGWKPTDGKGVAVALKASSGSKANDNFIIEPIRLGNIYGEHCGTGFAGNVWDKEAISPTLMTMQGGNRQPMIMVEQPTIQRVGRINSSQDGIVVDPNGIAPTHTAGHGNMPKVIVQEPINPLPNGMWRIRKLTPKECWRLMGFDDEDFDKAETVNSNTQLYKQAGNSIVVDVLEMLLKNVEPYLTTTTDHKETEEDGE